MPLDAISAAKKCKSSGEKKRRHFSNFAQKIDCGYTLELQHLNNLNLLK